MDKRRKFIGQLFTFVGGIFVTSPYAKAMEHLEGLNLTTQADSLQRQLIDSNVEYALAAECGIYGNPVCRESFCMGPVPMKNKCAP